MKKLIILLAAIAGISFSVPFVPPDAGTGVTDGVDGIDGINGTNGVNGVDGAHGVDGAVGETGAAGTNGTNGTNGTDGVDGTNAVTVGLTMTVTSMHPDGVSTNYMTFTNGLYVAFP